MDNETNNNDEYVDIKKEMDNETNNNDECMDIDKEEESIANKISEKKVMAIGIMNELSELEQMQKIIEEYKNSTDMKLVEFAEKFLDGKNKEDSKSKFLIGEASERQIKDINNMLGLNVSDYTNVLPADTVRHIDNRHGVNGKQDSSMQEINDIARVKYVLDNYDSVQVLREKDRSFYNIDGTHAFDMLFAKRINGTVYVIEAVPDSKRKELIIRTMYKEKTVAKQLSVVEEGQHKIHKPLAHVRNELTSSSSNSIPQKQKHVKRIHKKSNDDRER